MKSFSVEQNILITFLHIALLYAWIAFVSQTNVKTLVVFDKKSLVKSFTTQH